MEFVALEFLIILLISDMVGNGRWNLLLFLGMGNWRSLIGLYVIIICKFRPYIWDFSSEIVISNEFNFGNYLVIMGENPWWVLFLYISNILNSLPHPFIGIYIIGYIIINVHSGEEGCSGDKKLIIDMSYIFEK